MQSLKFEQLLILSDSNKLANQFQFSPRLNLITANNNSVGKSTLAKLLFWSLGCEPALDTNWASLDCKTIVYFKIGEKRFSVRRQKNQIELKYGNDLPVKFNKITGEFSERMADLLNFKVLLPNKTSKVLEVPPPAYYFLPFYIDQKKSWSETWNNFENLQQYGNWKSTIVKYHVGLLTPSHFALEVEKYQKSSRQNEINDGIQKINIALDIVKTHIPYETISTINNEKLQNLTNEINIELQNLERTQESLLQELVLIQGDKSYLEKQREISERIIFDLEEDYQFAVERIPADELECPLCGIVHSNSLVNRASIMTDVVQAQKQLAAVTSDISILDAKIQHSQQNLSIAKSQIKAINEKYVTSEEGNNVTYESIIKQIGGKALQEGVQSEKDFKVTEVAAIEGEIKEIKKRQNAQVSKHKKEEIMQNFLSKFTELIDLLGAEAVNLSKINSPLDFARLVKEGGAAESSRAMLAYYLTIYSLVEIHAHEVKAPLVVDTPNQHEQTTINYDKIISILTSKLNTNAQIFLCAMNNPQLLPYSKNAKIIELGDSKLLLKDQFNNVKYLFEIWHNSKNEID